MLGLGVGVAEAWALAAWAFAAAASSANSWVGQACGVGPHVQDWFWAGLAGWRAQILTFHPFPIKPHEFFIGKG